MIYQKRIQLTKLALALSIALAGAPALAQNTTSAVGGRITSPDGAPAAGASVQIIHTESGSVSNVTTDAQGRYVARGLRTGGPYTIIITKNGVTEKREGIFLQLAETAAVDATIGAPMQTVTVAGNRARAEIFNRSNMGSGTAISAAQLQSQASLNRNLQDYARADPRVSQTDKERGEMSVAGQNSRYNTITIDGVNVSDTFGLESNGSPTARQPISIEAIQSVQVNVANYDVTQKGYTGGNINAVTKSGTNKWKGGVYYVYRNDKLAGDRYDITKDTYSAPPKFDETTKGVWASGPLIQDKLFIFALSEESSSTRSSSNYGPLGSGAATTVGVTQSSIASAQQIAKSVYGVDIGTVTAGGAPMTSREQLLKFDWNITDDHRASLRYSKTSQADPIFPGYSSSGVGLTSSAYNQEKAIETIVGQVFSDWTPTFATEFKVSQRNYDSVPRNSTRLPALALQFSGPLPAGSPAGVPTGSRYLNFGTEYARQFNVLGTKTLDLYAGGNWTVGDHEIKFGADNSKNEIYNAYLQNVFGSYTFGCADYSAIGGYTSVSSSFTCSKGSNAEIEAAVLENFRRGRATSYTVQIPAPGVSSLDEAVADFSMRNTGLFLQDTWSVNKNLTLTYGVRVDETGVGGRPLANAAAAQPVVPGVFATGKAQSGGFGYDNTVTPDGQKLWQPRFGFNYRLDTARPTQVRGGFGLFQGAAATVWMANPFSNPGVSTNVISCTVGNAKTPCPTTDGWISMNPDKQPSIAGVPPAANVDFLDPGLKQPAIWKSNVAFETELPWYGLVLTGEYLYAKNKSAITYENLNLGGVTATGPDGRQLFWNAGGMDAANYTASNGSVSTKSGTVTSRFLSNRNFSNVILAKSTDKGDSKVATIALTQPMTKGIGWSVAYTRTDATEVSPLTSSVSYSNWRGRSVFNPNEDVASNSSYLVKDRVNFLINYEKKFFGEYKTRFGLFYEGRSGKPFSWTTNNDMNGDGESGNDLLYIPKAFGSGEVLFYGDTASSHVNEQKFWDIVNGNKALRNAKGGVVGRNSDFAPWTNSFDLRISQEIPGMFARNKAFFSLDFFNFGNLLNKKWGHINEIGFQSAGGQARSFVDYVGMQGGKYVYAVRPQVENYDVRQVKGESQWAIQATVKYEF
jgi:hypothetical protein